MNPNELCAKKMYGRKECDNEDRCYKRKFHQLPYVNWLNWQSRQKTLKKAIWLVLLLQMKERDLLGTVITNLINGEEYNGKGLCGDIANAPRNS